MCGSARPHHTGRLHARRPRRAFRPGVALGPDAPPIRRFRVGAIPSRCDSESVRFRVGAIPGDAVPCPSGDLVQVACGPRGQGLGAAWGSGCGLPGLGGRPGPAREVPTAAAPARPRRPTPTHKSCLRSANGNSISRLVPTVSCPHWCPSPNWGMTPPGHVPTGSRPHRAAVWRPGVSQGPPECPDGNGLGGGCAGVEKGIRVIIRVRAEARPRAGTARAPPAGRLDPG
jgi:hypothetical protein